MKRLLFYTVTILYSGFIFGQQSNILLKTGSAGEIIEGSIDNLIASIRQGNEIRVGWKLDIDNDSIPDLEHWVDASFISILNGHVFNQITPIYMQLPKIEIPQIDIHQSSIMWTAVIGTNGKLVSRFIFPELDKIEDENRRKGMEEILKIEENVVPTIWAEKKQ
ncbi:hypothetical protein GTQ40_03425 [Flavobacteriaceae bacterium R38]|nr:hypothetical protein [Flavobacteriaceae bacterium R38]